MVRCRSPKCATRKYVGKRAECVKPNQWQVYLAKQSQVRTSRGKRGLTSQSAARQYRRIKRRPSSKQLCNQYRRYVKKSRTCRPRRSKSRCYHKTPRTTRTPSSSAPSFATSFSPSFAPSLALQSEPSSAMSSPSSAFQSAQSLPLSSTLSSAPSEAPDNQNRHYRGGGGGGMSVYIDLADTQKAWHERCMQALDDRDYAAYRAAYKEYRAASDALQTFMGRPGWWRR